MTVAELQEELNRFSPDAEVVICQSIAAAYRLLGVFALNGKIWLDPSQDEKDRIINSTSDYYDAKR